MFSRKDFRVDIDRLELLVIEKGVLRSSNRYHRKGRWENVGGLCSCFLSTATSRRVDPCHGYFFLFLNFFIILFYFGCISLACISLQKYGIPTSI